MRLAAGHGTNLTSRERLLRTGTGWLPVLHHSGSLGCLMGAVLGYLDPGSGSMILQVVAGGAAAAAVAGRLFWRRIAIMLRLKKKDDGQQP
jgi:hypothetical protein